MNELTITKTNGVETTDSRQVAELIGKEHKELLRDIRKYCGYLGESKIALTEFFLESTYTTEQNKQMPCYKVTKKGCEMIANKLTGQKGVTFTALYVNAFHDMANQLKEGKKPIDKSKDLDVKLMNARVRMSNQYLKLSKVDTLSENYKSVLVAKAAQVLSDEELLPLPKSKQKMYSATEVGEILGVTAQKIGKISNANGMKTNEYGEWFRDKSPHSNKEVDSFRYNDKAVEKFRELL